MKNTNKSNKTLIVYYSRTQITKKVAEELSAKLNSDIEEIIDIKSRTGPIGYIIAGKEASQKKLATIQKIKKDPKKYDTILIGTPIWAWTITPAIRTYLTENLKNISEKKIALFATQGGSGADKAFLHIEELLGKKAIATLALTTKEVMGSKSTEKIKEFIVKIK